MEQVEMDSSVWENLSLDVLRKILAFLPSPSCLRFRAVCRAWKEMIDSNEFLDLCSELWLERPWFLVFQRSKIEAVHMYDPRDRKWYSFPLSFLPVPVHGRAAAGSLLCVEESNDKLLKALYICDPLAKTWVRLPPMMEETYMRRRSVTLMVDEFVGAFKLFVGCNYRLQVYDSLSASWHRLGRSPLVSVVLCKPRCTLYSLSPEPGLDLVPKPYQLLRFGLDDHVWRLVDVRMPRFLTSPNLAASEEQGRIAMVGGVWIKTMVRSLRIWELNFEKNAWDEVSKVPDKYWKQFRAAGWNTACAWRGEWISIACGNRVLCYNVSTGDWDLSPPNDTDPLYGSSTLVASFRPTFVAPGILEAPRDEEVEAGVPMN